MPELEISREELGPRRGRATLVYLGAIMLWPDVPATRQRAFAAFDASRIKDALDEVPDEFFPAPAIMRELCGFMGNAPRLADIDEEIKKAVFHGIATGLVLAGIIHRRNRRHPKAQLGELMDVVSNRLSGCNGFQLSRKTMNNVVWPRYRPVAPLWASYVDAATNSRDSTFPCRLDRLADFLAIAEWYRIEGESFQPKQSNHPVLARGESWSMPA